MCEWKEISIGSLGNVVTGNTPPTANRTFYGGPHPFIKPTDMEKDSRHVKSWEETYSNSAFQKYKNSYIPKGAIGVVTIGTVGEKIFQADRPCFTNQSVNVVIPNENFDENFVYYLLKFNLYKVINANPGTASGRDHVSKSNFCSIKVAVPSDKNIQREIGLILSSYDDLIENNDRRIAILEQMADNIYKEWFVRMRFPGYENTIFEKGIPKGWEVVELNKIAKQISTGIRPGEHLEGKFYLPLESFGVRKINPDKHYGYEEAQSSLVSFKKGDFLFGAMRPYQHKINIAPFDGITRSTSLVLAPRIEHCYCYLFFLLFQNSTVEFSTLISNGSDRPYVVWNKSFEKMKVYKPNESILKKFNSVVKPMLEVISDTYFINNNLKQTRDLLLPRLISGKLRVKNLQKPLKAQD